MHLSIVTTVYQSEDYILDFYSRITQISEEISENNYEIIIVNDGSEDLSLSIIKEIHNDDSKVSIINLSRNFGHHRALMVGLEYACGEIIFLIDSDLEPTLACRSKNRSDNFLTCSSIFCPQTCFSTRTPSNASIWPEDITVFSLCTISSIS